MITPNTDKLGNPCPHRGAGGVAYGGKFGEADYFEKFQPAWVLDFVTIPSSVAAVASHEMGHNLGLTHDGTSSEGYYGGHDAVPDAPDWAPIMGTSYRRNMTQWSKASEYYDGNQPQDDLSIIAARLGYRPDDHGTSFGTASALVNPLVKVPGVIENTQESDHFKFTTETGIITFDANSYRCDSGVWGSNLDIKLELYDEFLNLMATSNPLDDTDASIKIFVPKGTYHVVVKPTDAGNPLNASPTGYTLYGSLGSYTLTGLFIPSDAVQLAYPMGGETVHYETTVEIAWGSSIPGNVDIKLYKAGTTFAVTFSPSAMDFRFADLQIASNDIGKNPFEISLRRTGTGLGSLTVSPSGDLVSTGPQGGPFASSVQNYTLENTGGSSIPWTAAKLQNWISLSGYSGSLEPGASITVTAYINGRAEALGVGNYSDTITFTNTSNTLGDTTRSVTLSVSNLTTLWEEDFDDAVSSPPGWNSNATSGSATWSVVASNAYNSANCYSAPVPSTKVTSHLVSESIAIPASATSSQILFWHHYSLQSGLDGGRVQLSLDGGAWFNIEDAGSGASFGKNGSNVTMSGSGTPSGRSDFDALGAWSGNSGGYVLTEINLTDANKYPEHSLRVRWSIATNSSTASSHWRVDSVSLKTDAGGLTLYEQWARGSFSKPFTDTVSSNDPDGDGLTNKQEFAFGLDPTVNSLTTLDYTPGGDIIVNGMPILQNFELQGESPEYHAVFIRRKDYAATGLTYSVEFSA